MSYNPKERPPEVRAAAMAALLQGQSVNEVARTYKVPKGTVSDWKRMAQESVGEPDNPTQKDNRGLIGELLTEYLANNLRALNAQAQLLADTGWLRTQSLQEVAVAHGIMTDKAVRLLEALSAGEEG